METTKINVEEFNQGLHDAHRCLFNMKKDYVACMRALEIMKQSLDENTRTDTSK